MAGTNIRKWRAPSAAVLVALGIAACGGSASPADPTSANPESLVGFEIAGKPEQTGGTTWSYRATVDGIAYDLQGILYKPAGAGPFPAVIVSHGNGGNANAYSRNIAQTMVTWGIVVIGTNSTHAANVPLGAPGTANEPGASAANVRRARKLVDLLRALGYVDVQRVAMHGHSMGAFVTAATLGAHPTLFRAASHTAGGSVPDAVADVAAPSESEVRGITTPYQLHHGDSDVVVPLSYDQRLVGILTGRGVVHELHVYPGASHSDVSSSQLVLDRVREWYRSKGLF